MCILASPGMSGVTLFCPLFADEHPSDAHPSIMPQCSAEVDAASWTLIQHILENFSLMPHSPPGHVSEHLASAAMCTLTYAWTAYMSCSHQRNINFLAWHTHHMHNGFNIMHSLLVLNGSCSVISSAGRCNPTKVSASKVADWDGAC